MSMGRALGSALLATSVLALMLSGQTHASLTAGVDATDPAAIFTAANFTGVASIRKGSPTNVLWAEAFGTLDFRGSIPMSVTSRFPVASNTKVYVAISLYQLQERGLVDLSRPVQDYITQADMAAFGYPSESTYCPVVAGDKTNTCRNITFTQLLSMQACIPDYTAFDDLYLPYPGSFAAAFGRYVSRLLVCEPGTVFYYSNPAFILAGYFVEKLSGFALAEYLAENIHIPLGQKDTYFDPYDGQFGTDLERVDEWYDFIDNRTGRLLSRGKCSREFDLGSMGGAGGLVSTQHDEALLYFALFNFSRNFNCAPLFKNRSTLIDLVQPRTFISVYAYDKSLNFYFAQGLFVAAPRVAADPPSEIEYEGEIVCSHTSNRFIPATYNADGVTEARPAYMAHAWTAVRVYYTSPKALVDARWRAVGPLSSIVSRWQPRPALSSLSFRLMQLFQAWLNF